MAGFVGLAFSPKKGRLVLSLESSKLLIPSQVYAGVETGFCSF